MISEFPIYVDIEASTYRESMISTVIRSDFDSGFAKQRRQYCASFKRVSFDISICNERYDDFISWWKNDINMGADWFLFVDPSSEKQKRARLIEFDIDLRPDKLMRKWNTSISMEIFDNG